MLGSTLAVDSRQMSHTQFVRASVQFGSDKALRAYRSARVLQHTVFIG